VGGLVVAVACALDGESNVSLSQLTGVMLSPCRAG